MRPRCARFADAIALLHEDACQRRTHLLAGMARAVRRHQGEVSDDDSHVGLPCEHLARGRIDGRRNDGFDERRHDRLGRGLVDRSIEPGDAAER